MVLVVRAEEGGRMNVLGHAATLKLARQETAGTYYVFVLTTPPGLGVPPHVHKNEAEIIEVIEGEFEVQLGQETYRATAGSLIHFPRFIPHAFRNVGTTSGRTHWTVIPGINFEQFFAELGALPPGPPDMAQVAAIFQKYEIDLVELEPDQAGI